MFYDEMKYLPRSRVIAGIIATPFIICGIFLSRYFQLGRGSDLIGAIVIALFMGKVASISFEVIKMRKANNLFTKIILAIHNFFWKNDL